MIGAMSGIDGALVAPMPTVWPFQWGVVRRLALTPHFAEKALFASVPLASTIEGVLS